MRRMRLSVRDNSCSTEPRGCTLLDPAAIDLRMKLFCKGLEQLRVHESLAEARQ